jgi:hypothetical protein
MSMKMYRQLRKVQYTLIVTIGREQHKQMDITLSRKSEDIT